MGPTHRTKTKSSHEEALDLERMREEFFPGPVQPITIWSEYVSPLQMVSERRLTPFERLSFAIISASWNTLRVARRGKPSVRKKRIIEEEEAWVRANDERWPFSFVRICWTLNFDAEKVRQGMLFPPKQGEEGNVHKRTFQRRAVF